MKHPDRHLALAARRHGSVSRRRAFAVSQTFTIGPDCPVNVTSIAMSTHCGAHVDAPLHYDPQGASIDTLDLGDFIGPARVIDARGSRAALWL